MPGSTKNRRLFAALRVTRGAGLSALLLGCGPATQSDPAFWAPYGGGEGGSSAATGATGSSVEASAGSGGGAGGTGSLAFTFTTVSMDGEFAPKNVGAVWVADAQDTFIKTLEVWAAKRDKHLVRWRAASAANVVDAVTGATKKSHVEHTSLWDGTDTAGAAAPNGAYRVYVEFTEWNSSEAGEPQGPWTVADFVKGPEPADLFLPDEASFLGKHLVWTP